MRSLFCKIFTSFVGITLFASFTTIAISYWAQIGPYAELSRRVEQHQNQTLRQFLSVSGIAAERILSMGGEQALISYLAEVEKIAGGQIFLIRTDNSTVSGRTLPEHADNLITACRNSSAIQYNRSDTEVMAAFPLSRNDGQPLIVLGTTIRIFWPPAFNQTKGKKHFPGPIPLGLPLIVMLLIAATGCFLLARSLTAPIRALRSATQQMSKGDFSARVSIVTKRKDEIAVLGQDFNIMAEKTQSLLHSQKRLLRDISHELRSPLTRLNLALELARQRSLSAEPNLARIEKESDRLNELISQLLILTRLEGDVTPVSKEAVPLKKLLTDIVRDADFEAKPGGRKVKIVRLDGATVLGTPEMLGRAFENVIRNALRYTKDGSAVELRVIKDTSWVTIFVRDYGPGVQEEYLEQIFKPFFRTAEARDRDSGGSGIGLAIARQAIITHGGTISAQNGENGGLLVQMRLPLL